jgi:phage FluMu protein Com
MQVTCIKCNHVNPNATGSAHDACPKCGVIYAKAQQAMAPATAVRRPVANSRLEQSSNQFIEELREASIYPTFRSVINLGYVLGLVLAVLLALGGLVGGYKAGSFGTAFGAVVAAIVIAVIARFMKEASLMLADMSDATVLMAKKSTE